MLAELQASSRKLALATPMQWAEESCRIVGTDSFYPAVHRIEPNYVQAMAPVLKDRIAFAAQRLAALLNRALLAQ